MNKKLPIILIICLIIISAIAIVTTMTINSHDGLMVYSLLSAIFFLVFGVWAIILGFKLRKNKKDRRIMITNFILGVISILLAIVALGMFILENAIIYGM
ncbi:MAG: hypothetical protein ABIG28_01585 [archaeon]